MLQRHECEALLVEHLEWMQRAMGALCRRYAMAAADAEDFVSWATLRLIEDDFEVLRRFRGDSAFRTYLAVVITMLHRDYRARFWGRFRPSAAARSAGAVGIELERLTRRDGLSVGQAVDALRTRVGASAPTERELVHMARRLTTQAPSPRADLAQFVADAVAPLGADERVAAAEAAAERRAVEAALARAMDGLSADDRRLLQLRFWSGLTIADIARRLDVAQKPLYRRMERALLALRRRLEEAGVSRKQVLEIVDVRAA